jgi:hypothetical protein
LSRTVTIGATVQFGVTATSAVPPTFQWRKNGVPIQNATGDFLTISNAGPADAGSYSVLVMNSAGSATSLPAVVRVNTPPAISRQPESQAASEGNNVTFSVAADGSSPLVFQWHKGDGALSGATTAMLAFNAIQLTDAGAYTVTVSNAGGSVTSAAASLTVTPDGPGSRLSNVSIRTLMLDAC